MLLVAATFSSAAGFSLGRVPLPTAQPAVCMSAMDDAAVITEIECTATTLLRPISRAFYMPQAKARWLARTDTPSWGVSEVDEAAALISTLKIEAQHLHDRGRQLEGVVAELEAELQVHQRMAQSSQTRDSSASVVPQAESRGGQTAEGMAHSCLDDGCPVNTVSDLIAELKVTLALALTLTLTTDP